MKLKKLVAALGVALPLAFAAATAHSAVSLNFEDDDVEFLLSPTGVGGALLPKLSGNFAVGDVIVSLFEIPNYRIGGVNALPAGQELTGIAAIQIKSISGFGVGGVITFEAVSGGLNSLLTGGQTVMHGGAGQGAVLAMYLNSTADFNLDLNFTSNPTTNCTSRAQCTAEATAGSLLQVDGFKGDLDEYWTSVITRAGGANPATVAGVGGALGVATFDAALTTIFNAPGTVVYQNIFTNAECPTGSLALDNCVAGPIITGPITGGLGLGAGIRADGAFARSDLDASKLMVPEPGTLALAGLSLLGLAVAGRRRK